MSRNVPERHLVVVRCDGDATVGMGHVVRCIAVATELRERGCSVVFAVRSGAPALRLIETHGFPSEVADGPDEETWLLSLLERLASAVLVLDVRTELSQESVARLRSHVLVVVVDDPSDRRLAADIAVYPPVPQVRRFGWEGFTGELLSGWEWVLLREGFARRPRKPSDEPRLLLTFGGSDPPRLTERTLQVLDELPRPFSMVVVVGAGFGSRSNDLAVARWNHQVSILNNVRDMPAVMAEADLAVAAFGMTAYELTAMGCPSILLSFTEDHEESATCLTEVGVARSLGVHDRVEGPAIAQAVLDLLDDAEQRSCMAERAAGLIDGRGAERLAGRIIEEMTKRRGAATP